MPSGVYKHPPQCGFQKGVPNCMLGKHLSKKTKMKISLARKGKKFPNLSKALLRKNNLIGKLAIHRRIEQILGKPNYCEHCKRTDQKRYDWSNKNHKYSLNIKDWQRLCRKCHKKYDFKYNNLKTHLKNLLELEV